MERNQRKHAIRVAANKILTMRTPELHHADEICFGPETTIRKHPHNVRVLVRPLSASGLNFRQRLRMAWGVFTGNYDALSWFDLPNDKFSDADRRSL